MALSALSCSGDGRIPEEEARRIEGVFRAGLSSPESYMRAETVRAIGITGSPALAPLLEEALKDEHPLVRSSAALRLARYDLDKARSHLVSSVTAGDDRTRRIVVREVLSAISGEDLQGDLVQIALRSEDAQVRLRALEYGLLTRLNTDENAAASDRELVPQISNLVDDPDPIIAGLALTGLVRQSRKDRLRDLFKQTAAGSLKKQKRALRVLAEARLPSSHQQLRQIAEESEGTKRREALIALTALGEKAWMDDLREALKGADEATTIHTIRAMSHTDSHQGLRLLRTYRLDSRVGVRLAVQEALSLHPHVDNSDFKPGLKDKEPGVAIEAMRGLLRAAPTFVPSMVRELLKDETQTARILQVLIATLHAVEVDGDVKELDRLEKQLAGLEEDLTPLLNDPSPFARSASAELLFKRRDPLTLFKTIEAPKVEVTYALLDALAKSPPAEAPLSHLEFFKGFDRAELQSLQIIAAAGIWNAYRLSAALGSGQ